MKRLLRLSALTLLAVGAGCAQEGDGEPPLEVDGVGDVTGEDGLEGMGSQSSAVLFGSTLTVARAGAGWGTVTSAPAGIDCGTDCTQVYFPRSSVTLTATPAAGSRFVGWDVAACGSNSTCSITMFGSRTVTATFAPGHRLDVRVSGLGSVQSVPQGIGCPSDCAEFFSPGTTVTLFALPVTNGVFTGWDGVACTHAQPTCEVRMDRAHTVTAKFHYTLTVVKEGNGYVQTSQAQISCGDRCAASFPSGARIGVSAIPAQGWLFAGWTGCTLVSGSDCWVDMTGNKVITPFFLPAPPPTYRLTVSRYLWRNSQGSVRVNGQVCNAIGCDFSFPAGTPVTLEAVPGDYSVFAGWSGGCSGFGPVCTITMNEPILTVSAAFDYILR